MKSSIPKRVAITGMGIIVSMAHSIDSFRYGLFKGVCGIGPISVFDSTGFECQNAGEVKTNDFDTGFERATIKRSSRCDLLGLTAFREAFQDSRLGREKSRGDNIAVVLGGGAGGMLSWERFRRTLWYGNKKARPSPLLSSSPSTLTDLIASLYGFAGYRATISTACSSSATSIGYGYDLIKSGTQEVVITGGSEALSELTFAGFSALRSVDPDYCRPFDRNRRGLSLGEGAAFLVLEDYEYAGQRGAKIYAEVAGYATNSDAFHMTSPDPEAEGMTRVMQRALKNASIQPEQVDYVNAHGTGTKINDRLETKALKRVFGSAADRLCISSTKSMLGHCLGAAGAVEAAATVLALVEQAAPPTINLEDADPDCDLDYVAKISRPLDIGTAMSNSFAFGGNNTSLVFRRA